MPPGLAETNLNTSEPRSTNWPSLSQITLKKKELLTSLPAGFYHSSQIYELERRAIFSKCWFLVSHKARYRNVGDYVQYEMAGFNFVVLKNKDGNIIGWHNACRHRAFPLVQKYSGNARIFSCKYHGWTYSLDGGKLTKAPRFTSDSVPSFDPSSIRLFPIHVHVDRNGFVYVNLDAKAVPQVSWEEQYGDLDQQAVLVNSGVDWDAVEYDSTWTEEGRFNWKIMQDNYNECYHCSLVHPLVATTTDLTNYYVVPGPNNATYIAHFSQPLASKPADQFSSTRFNGRSATHVFPVGHFSPNPGTGFMHLMRTVPTSATTCRQEYDVYRLNTPSATPEAHERMRKFYGQVTSEDVEVCKHVQKNVERGVHVRGPLHPVHEKGVKAFQEMVTRELARRLEDEEMAKRKIWPASERGEDGDGGDEFGGKDEVCEKVLGACQEGKKELEW